MSQGELVEKTLNKGGCDPGTDGDLHGSHPELSLRIQPQSQSPLQRGACPEAMPLEPSRSPIESQDQAKPRLSSHDLHSPDSVTTSWSSPRRREGAGERSHISSQRAGIPDQMGYGSQHFHSCSPSPSSGHSREILCVRPAFRQPQSRQKGEQQQPARSQRSQTRSPLGSSRPAQGRDGA